jgi:hypothetical protein
MKAVKIGPIFLPVIVVLFPSHGSVPLPLDLFERSRSDDVRSQPVFVFCRIRLLGILEDPAETVNDLVVILRQVKNNGVVIDNLNRFEFVTILEPFHFLLEVEAPSDLLGVKRRPVMEFDALSKVESYRQMIRIDVYGFGQVRF